MLFYNLKILTGFSLQDYDNLKLFKLRKLKSKEKVLGHKQLLNTLYSNN